VALIGIAQKIPAPALVDLCHLTRKAVPPEAIRRRAASQPPRVISIPPRRWP
jgi:hypothetical protein